MVWQMFLLFQRVQEMFGLRLKTETQERIAGTNTQCVLVLQLSIFLLLLPAGDLHTFEPLVPADIEEFSAVVTSVHRILFVEATALAKQASKTGAAELLRIADEKYNASVAQKPDDYRSLHNWGLSLMLQALSKRGEEADALFKLAASKFHAALAMDPRDYRALFLWASTYLLSSPLTSFIDSNTCTLLFSLSSDSFRFSICDLLSK